MTVKINKNKKRRWEHVKPEGPWGVQEPWKCSYFSYFHAITKHNQYSYDPGFCPTAGFRKLASQKEEAVLGTLKRRMFQTEDEVRRCTEADRRKGGAENEQRSCFSNLKPFHVFHFQIRTFCFVVLFRAAWTSGQTLIMMSQILKFEQNLYKKNSVLSTVEVLLWWIMFFVYINNWWHEGRETLENHFVFRALTRAARIEAAEAATFWQRGVWCKHTHTQCPNLTLRRSGSSDQSHLHLLFHKSCITRPVCRKMWFSWWFTHSWKLKDESCLLQPSCPLSLCLSTSVFSRVLLRWEADGWWCSGRSNQVGQPVEVKARQKSAPGPPGWRLDTEPMTPRRSGWLHVIDVTSYELWENSDMQIWIFPQRIIYVKPRTYCPLHCL